TEDVRRLAMVGEIAPPESLKTGVPRSLAAIRRKAMEVEPSRRYATALIMAHDLECYLSDEPISACSDGVAAKLGRLARRNRTASLLLLAMLLIGSTLLSIALAGQSVFARRAQDTARERLRLAATMAANIGGF